MAMPYEADNMSQTHIGTERESSPLAMVKQSSARKREPRRSSGIYQCAVENCAKVYSRAEHLSRHQLNHAPTQMYICDVPNCGCSFVRADLHSRHRTRHMREYLQQRDAQSNSGYTINNGSRKSQELTNSVADSMLNQPALGWVSPHHATNAMQISCEDIKSTSFPQPQANTADDFPMDELPNPVSIAFNQLHQNVNLSEQQQLLDIGMWRNEVHAPTTMPVFGGDSYTRSPFPIPDDFIQFLFNGTQPSDGTAGGTSSTTGFTGTHVQSQLLDNPNTDVFGGSYLPQLPFIPGGAFYQSALPSMVLSNEKSREVFNLIRDRLTSNKHAPVPDYQNDLLRGDRENDLNIMSRAMMQNHINNYWKHFHSSLPILHQPSFSPNKSPNLLLISIMIIGASCSVSSDDSNTAEAKAEFSKVLAWYLRWEIFASMHMQPESLWVFQALLLLETYEKIYSSRALHERAHIHHATTITLMRRGSFLAGRSPLNSPASYEDSESGSEKMTKHLVETCWDEWIGREATRRVVFAAFMMDTMHTAMFGHSMAMATHEIRLVLPCDDALWSATSIHEVQKIEMTLRANSIKPIPFLEGLQKTLNGQEISTHPFGRSILLCGLLSLSWHMSQRDMQIISLGIGSFRAPKRSKWVRSIARAVDLWKVSCEEKAQTLSGDMSSFFPGTDAVIEAGSTLYYLAQFSINVDIIECQIFAGANRVLGRTIGSQEVENVHRRIRKVWAPTEEARKATFYALQFLCSVFHKSTDSGQDYDHEVIVNYKTRNSPMHRWVLYCAALIVWSYSYAIDGPSHLKKSSGSSIDGHIQDMKEFLKRVEYIKSPEDVAFHRLNGCAGMLNVLRYIFRMETWELLREGADLLTYCIKLIENVG